MTLKSLIRAKAIIKAGLCKASCRTPAVALSAEGLGMAGSLDCLPDGQLVLDKCSGLLCRIKIQLFHPDCIC